jgi:hypothetical protein
MIPTMLALAILFAIVRVAIGLTCEPTHATLIDVFKDVVHVYMGVLGLLAWKASGLYRWLFWLLCVLEVSVAVLQRMAT